jgi:hypothetical protein
MLSSLFLSLADLGHQWAWGLTLGATGVLNYFTLRNAFAPETKKVQ